MKRHNSLLIFLVLVLFGVQPLYSQFGSPNDIVKIKTYRSLDKVYPNTEFKIAVEAEIKDGWHINSNTPNDDYLIPTKISLIDSTNFRLTKVVYPKAENLKLEFSDKPLSVWEGKVYLGGIIKSENLKPGAYRIIFNFGYQACNNQSCLPPNAISDTMIVKIASKKDAVNEINQSVFRNIDLTLNNSVIDKVQNSDNSISNLLESNGILLGLLIVFLGGLALNLTPCVYPLVPITIGFFGGQSEGNTKRLAIMGILFVFGLAVTYSVIGVVTSLTGAVFGTLLQNPVVIIAIALILVALSLSMFGVYEFKLPDKLVAKAGGAKGGYYGAFFMGLTLGIVAAPCIGPFVLGLVTYVAVKQDAFFGFIMFFVLALGLGTPYLFLAIFSGKIKNLPRSGEWMQAVEHIFGLILVGMAIYFLLPLIPKEVSGYVLPVYMLAAGVYIIFFERKASNIKIFKIIKTIFAVLVMTVAVYAVIPKEGQGINWKKYSESSISNTGSKAVIIDFYADWCIPCKELDANTFSDPEVVKISKQFDTYKADMTKSLDEEVEALRDKYKIIGVPTILILNSKGEEVNRITGFVNANEFLKIISDIN